MASPSCRKIEAQSENERAAENLRKFLLALSDDIRVLLVKLADRLHNMRTLYHIPSEEKRRRIARETMDIYAPLAERIGMYEMMKEMQTLAFRELEPDAFASITRRLKQLTDPGGDLVSRIGLGLQLYLADNGLEAEVTGRQKHPYSIWRKMAERHISFEQLSDVMAFRIIVKDAGESYRALGLIHQRWPMVPGRFKDYISTPKRNGYQSLHTSVIHDSKMRIEIQIRDRAMHELAERGLAAHWAYKEGKPQGDMNIPWVDDLVEILDHAESPEELLEHTRMAMYQDRIFAFTPKGELIQLPKGATPVDFAYAVHTDLGDRTVGAKVNGRVVPLRTMLENGDQVEILASEAQHPQPSWLRFVATGKARAGVRRFVRHKEREETIELGRKIYDEIVQRLPAELDKDALKRALKKLKIENQDELMIAIARKRVSDEALMEALMPGSAGGDVASPRPLGQRKAISIKGLTAGRRLSSRAMLPPDPRRPHRGPEARGRGDRGSRHRLRHASERRRRRLARPCLGRRFGRRRGAPRGDPARHSGRVGNDVRHPRRQARQHHQPSAGPSRRQLPDIPPRHRGARPRAPARHRCGAARCRAGQLGRTDLADSENDVPGVSERTRVTGQRIDGARHDAVLGIGISKHNVLGVQLLAWKIHLRRQSVIAADHFHVNVRSPDPVAANRVSARFD